MWNKDLLLYFCFQVCASLLRGSLKHLSVLNMSKTVFSHRSDVQLCHISSLRLVEGVHVLLTLSYRKCKEIPSSFKQFFSSAQALSSVSLSGTRLPLEALK